MNCYECGLRGEAVPAVATCKHCGAGMCLEHLAEAQRYRVGGTLFGCPHDLSAAATAPKTKGRLATDGRVRELAGTPR
jgi:hypothetical protein